MRVVSCCSPTLLNEMCRRNPDRGKHAKVNHWDGKRLRAQQTAPPSVLQAPVSGGQQAPCPGLFHIDLIRPAGPVFGRRMLGG